MRLAAVADWLMVAVAVSLPWSTLATGILLVLWLLVLHPNWRMARTAARTDDTGRRPAGAAFSARRAGDDLGGMCHCSSAGRGSICFSSCW